MAAKTWRCRGCLSVNPSRKRRCGACLKPKPPKRRPKHMAALDLPYEHYIEINGGKEECAICERGPSSNRRLDRDHDHKTGTPRGLLCHRDNRFLAASWLTPELLRSAAKYLERFARNP